MKYNINVTLKVSEILGHKFLLCHTRLYINMNYTH